ncbi:thiol-disulfide oxidoreductase DCC family protein [Paenibacillus sp. y28]|uniref:thiol-disulfide oxidoreductase DCC family protein n=1 Tax=Paenibacillus sp. y28 TaxID=3129110 RepID=UPI003FA7073C
MIPRDKRGYIHFASLQSDIGRRLVMEAVHGRIGRQPDPSRNGSDSGTGAEERQAQVQADAMFTLPLSQMPDSVILLERGRLYVKSSAALRAARHLSGLWPCAALLLAVPRPLRDAIYDWVAMRRYRWFGKADSCLMPTKDVRSRFLDL